jgi:signal transduction histidine kinase/ligand-binding sensor domain-containing protein
VSVADMHDRAMIRRPLGLLLAAALAISASAEPVDLLFQNWNSRDGLPQDHVRDIVRTRDGFLWLATDAGLARFDGSEFKTYGLREGLGAVAVVSLLEASDGALWIGTVGGGVSVMRQGRIERTYSRADGLPSGITPVLSQDDEGRIWASGVYRLKDDRFSAVPGSGSVAYVAFRDRDGAMWKSSGNKYWKEGKWTAVTKDGPQSPHVFGEDDAGRLWIVDAKLRLWCRESSGWKSWQLPAFISGRASSLSIAPDGTIWIACYRSGVCGFREGKFIEPRTDGEKFLDLAEVVHATPDGVLWMGSSTSGLYSLVPRRVELATLDGPAANRGANFIGGLAEISPGRFMVGTQGHGLFRWSQGHTEEVWEIAGVYRGLFANVVMRDRADTVWAGTAYGLHRFGDPPVSPPPMLLTGSVWDLCEDGAGGIWIGLGNGELHHLTADGKSAKINDGDGVPIKGLARGSDGRLWVGTRGAGLFRQKEDGQFEHLGVQDGLGSEVIRLVAAEEDGTVWVGTGGGGLSVLRGGRFHTVTTADGLPDDIVSQVHVASDGRLWLGTNRGIALFEKEDVAALKSGKSGPFHPVVINRDDGLIAEECTIVPPVPMSDGRLAFATTHGFAMLKPADFSAETTTPPVFIERVRANGTIIEPVGGKLELPPGLERLEIEFTGLHFAAPKRLQFRNRLKGLEEDWGSGGTQRRVEYRNLAPGDYRFELAGSIGNGLWTPQPATLDITLAPHFWQTAWFKIAVGLSSLGLVAAIARTIERARARRKIEALKREQAIQAERARIARDLHDDVGASLTQVALLSELADSDLDAEPELARSHINEIFTTAKEVTRSLDEIVWAVNPAQDTLERFAAFLGTFVQNYARTAGLNGRLDIPDELPDLALTSAIRHHLYLATKEALHNIVKHAGATEIRLRLIPSAKELTLLIEDNGRGLPERGRGEGDGLENFRKRLEQIGGTCVHRSVAGQGTTVQMRLPLG